jgi:hypothetical protein
MSRKRKKKSRSDLTDFFRQWIINRKQTEGSSGTAPEIVYVNPHQCQPGMSVQMHTVIKFNLHLFCCISLETGTPSKKPRVTVIQYNFQICLFCWIKICQLHITCFIIWLFTAQRFSNVSTSIFRSLRLIVDLFHVLYCSGSICVGVTVWFGWGGNTVTPTHIEPDEYNTWNTSTISRKLLRWMY